MGKCDMYLDYCLSKDSIGPTQVRINHPPSSFPNGFEEKKFWKVRKIFHHKELKTMFLHQMKLNMDLRGAQMDHKGLKTVFLSFFHLDPFSTWFHVWTISDFHGGIFMQEWVSAIWNANLHIPSRGLPLVPWVTLEYIVYIVSAS